MTEISHRDRRQFGHPIDPMPATDVALDPAYQTMLRRLLAHGICDTNSRVIDRMQVAVQVASVIRQKREARL